MAESTKVAESRRARSVSYPRMAAWNADRLPALRTIGSTRNSRTLARILALLVLVILAALVWTPWVQTVTGGGSVVAYAPIERRQDIEAPISGRIVRWEVVEGSTVEKGELLVELSDNDPQILERYGRERDATQAQLEAALRKASSYREKVRGLELTQINAVRVARSKIDMAKDKVEAAEQAVTASEAELETAQLNIDRVTQLAERGLNSTRSLELTRLTYNKARADVDKARASLNAERNNQLAMESDLLKVEADMSAKIEDARASLEAAVSDAEKARAELTKIDVKMARQGAQRIMAPIDGTIFRVLGRVGGELVKEGEVLCVLIPQSTKNVVELWVDGNDVPLISPGRDVRLQFEGWPALQFSGWPSIAVGTFGGRVLQVDAADNGQGRFRILVEHDEHDEPWPSQSYLRQGVRANGWVLLNQVSLGWELWRQFNGFPPVISPDEPGLGDKAKGAAK